MKQSSTSPLALVAMAAASQAASVTFWTLDQAQRTIYFTPNPGSAQMSPLTVGHLQNTTAKFPSNWAGNFYAVQSDGENKPGMLGEVQFSGWLGRTYFDVSAIVDGTDHSNVKQMWPKLSRSPMSGCEVFPCNNCYWLPDDIQTKVTEENDLMATLGSGSTGIVFAKPDQEAPDSSQAHHAPQYQPSAPSPPAAPPALPVQPGAAPAVAPYQPVQPVQPAAAPAAPQYQPVQPVQPVAAPAAPQYQPVAIPAAPQSQPSQSAASPSQPSQSTASEAQPSQSTVSEAQPSQSAVSEAQSIQSAVSEAQSSQSAVSEAQPSQSASPPDEEPASSQDQSDSNDEQPDPSEYQPQDKEAASFEYQPPSQPSMQDT
ncbi:hypothetical protein XA68_10440 [Ophiocordyceps unilateralis]|uniref:DNase1 protein n=1 Tax=Ophiocordyceps unilateralis TaxID=268505 RepID=A0A2A9PII7_OPHUN|nr:hypothetical protein XA68_10440 [Ophiocordyceps unilateralis]